MIVVKIELHPLGFEKNKRSLGLIEISNDLTGTKETGNYKYKIFKWGRGRRVWKCGRVEGISRSKRGPWDILYRCLQEAVGSRNRV